jgi:hypothetical protein
VSFAAIILCFASQRAVPKVSVHFVIDSVRKPLDTPSYSGVYVPVLSLVTRLTCLLQSQTYEPDVSGVRPVPIVRTL